MTAKFGKGEAEFSFKHRTAPLEESKILSEAAQENPSEKIKIEAEKLFEAAEKRREEERAPEDYLALALKAWEDKSFEEGLGWAYSGLNLHPKNNETRTELFNALGMLYGDLNSYDLAEKNYKKALEVDDKAYWVCTNLGNTYFNQKKYEDAERQYKETLQFDPDDVDAHYNLGLLYFDWNRLEDALDKLNVALSLGDNNMAELMAVKAIIILRMGSEREALGLYREAVSIDATIKDHNMLKERYPCSDQAQEAARELIQKL